MVYWPFTSSLFGVSVITSFLTILAVGSLHNVLFDQLFLSFHDGRQSDQTGEEDEGEETMNTEAQLFEGSEEMDDIFN